MIKHAPGVDNNILDNRLTRPGCMLEIHTNMDTAANRVNCNRLQCTVNVLVSRNDDKAKWHLAVAEPTEEQKKLLVAILLSVGMRVVMESHTFMVGDTIYCQTHGGAIGLELTMEVSLLFTCHDGVGEALHREDGGHEDPPPEGWKIHGRPQRLLRPTGRD